MYAVVLVAGMACIAVSLVALIVQLIRKAAVKAPLIALAVGAALVVASFAMFMAGDGSQSASERQAVEDAHASLRAADSAVLDAYAAYSVITLAGADLDADAEASAKAMGDEKMVDAIRAIADTAEPVKALDELPSNYDDVKASATLYLAEIAGRQVAIQEGADAGDYEAGADNQGVVKAHVAFDMDAEEAGVKLED